MATKYLLSVGYSVPGNAIEYVGFYENKSLLDADIILFCPTLAGYSLETHNPTYQGKPSLSDDSSARLKEASEHWRRELKIAYESGKTIWIFLHEYQEVIVDTGERRYSGTGRGRQTTRIVKTVNNYECIPFDLGSIFPGTGERIKPARDLGPFTNYWLEYSSISPYKLHIENDKVNPLLLTENGDRIVGFRISGKGNFIFVPPIEYDEESFTEYDEEDDKNFWTKEATKFGNRFVKILIDLDSALRSEQQGTPPPDWVSADEFILPLESKIRSKISKLEKSIEELNDEKKDLIDQIEEEAKIRNLLFEKGPLLEEGVRMALLLLEFDVTHFNENDSEFDALFESEEGRFLGEVEGKDKKAINVDKISQLQRNLQEDFARDEVDDYAIGVLFGNADRLARTDMRQNYFTEKCKKTAERLKISLVRTPDLFNVVKAIKEGQGKGYTKACREALIAGQGGVVEFPQPIILKSKKK